MTRPKLRALEETRKEITNKPTELILFVTSKRGVCYCFSVFTAQIKPFLRTSRRDSDTCRTDRNRAVVIRRATTIATSEQEGRGLRANACREIKKATATVLIDNNKTFRCSVHLPRTRTARARPDTTVDSRDVRPRTAYRDNRPRRYRDYESPKTTA